jgi:hypothetical protein
MKYLLSDEICRYLLGSHVVDESGGCEHIWGLAHGNQYRKLKWQWRLGLNKAVFYEPLIFTLMFFVRAEMLS